MSVFSEASRITGIPKDTIERTYNCYWRAIREHISSLPLKEGITKEGFDSMKTSVNIPSIGKLYVTYDRWKAMREKYNEHVKNK